MGPGISSNECKGTEFTPKLLQRPVPTMKLGGTEKFPDCTDMNSLSCLKLFGYQREVDKGKLTAVASFEKLTFRA